MFDLDRLYKKYLFYKLKKLLPFLLLIVVIIATAFWYGMDSFKAVQKPLPTQKRVEKQKVVKKKELNKEQKREPQKLQEKPKVVKKAKQKPQINRHYKFFTLSVKKNNLKAITTVQERYKKFGLTCRIEDQNNYLNLVCGETNSYAEYEKIKGILEKHHIKYFLVTKKEVPVTEKKATPPVQQTAVVKKEITLTKMSHADVDMNLLQKKFANHESYAIAIRIAKEYYSKKDYKNSLVWAKKANNLDRRKTQSWVLYARSLYALGEKAKAVKVLMLYKRFASSAEVDRILQGWQNDK